ncbi:MAG: hypothetical protein ACKVQU_14485 [Burkholderiales bacterium]
MKTLKSLVLAKSIAVAAFVAAGLASPSISVAGGANGVSCPAGYDATPASSFNGVMKCSKVVTTPLEIRKSVCPGIAGIQFIYEQRVGARDVCKRTDNGTTVATVPELVLDIQNWRLDQDGATGALDRFLKGGQQRTEFTFPQGAIFLGDAEKGAKCPSGSTAKYASGVLRCEDERKNSACVSPGNVYKLDVRDGTDKCVLDAGVFGTNVQSTVPSGEYTSVGWNLDVDGPAGGTDRDQWVKFTDAVAVGF